MTTPNIPTAVAGTVKAWFDPSIHMRLLEALPSGPWSDEPNKMQWVDRATGLPCLIVRGPLGSLCGYAGIYPLHPFHKKDYDAVDLDVHGGLTFSGACSHSDDEAQGICHVPEPGTSDDVWWFGFDCAHCGDKSPGMLRRGWAGFDGDVYRDVDYVAGEVTSLAAQLDVLGDVTRAVAALPQI
jgi:hypothetical protein